MKLNDVGPHLGCPFPSRAIQRFGSPTSGGAQLFGIPLGSLAVEHVCLKLVGKPGLQVE